MHPLLALAIAIIALICCVPVIRGYLRARNAVRDERRLLHLAERSNFQRGWRE